jgi:hypothetical protein
VYFPLKKDGPRDDELNLRIAKYSAQNAVFDGSYFRVSIGRKLKIELEIVNILAFEFVLDDKGWFAFNDSDGSRVHYSERSVSGMRSAKKASPCFSTCLYRTNSRFVPQDEETERAGKDAILFRTIDPQSVVRGGAAEPVARCYVARVAARARIAEHFPASHSQNETEFVIVGVAAFAENSVWNREKQNFSGTLFHNPDPGFGENFGWVGEASIEMRFD